MTADRKAKVEKEYVDNVGRPPNNLPDDHPDKWQWDYRGTKDEREQLMGLIDIADEQIDQEESLF